MIRAYVRVSTDKQDVDMQTLAITSYIHRSPTLQNKHIEFFEEYASGACDDRPVLNEMIKFSEPGDIIIVYKLDRFSRSLSHLIKLLEGLHELNISFISISESIDLSTAVGKLQFHIIAAFAEFEREMIVDRVNSGIKAKQERVRQGTDTWNGRGPDKKVRRRPVT